MYMYIYVYMLYMYMYTYTCVYVYIYIYIHICTHVYNTNRSSTLIASNIYQLERSTGIA